MLMGFPTSAKASVTYVFLNQTVSSYNFDINGDGPYDYYISGTTLTIQSLGATRCVHGNGSTATGLNYGALINSSLLYSCNTTISAATAMQTSLYLGIKFTILGQAHYGWISASDELGSYINVYAFAYQTTPNTPVEAGKTTELIGIDENEESIPEISIKQIDDIVQCNSLNNSIQELRITDLQGHEITHITPNSFSYSLKIPTAGIYIMSVQLNNGSFHVKKFAVIN